MSATATTGLCIELERFVWSQDLWDDAVVTATPHPLRSVDQTVFLYLVKGHADPRMPRASLLGYCSCRIQMEHFFDVVAATSVKPKLLSVPTLALHPFYGPLDLPHGLRHA